METLTPTPLPDRLWIGNTSGCTGDLIEVPVYIDNPSAPVDVFMLDIGYCPSMLEFQYCLPGELTLNWIQLGCNVSEIGVVIAGGFTIDNATRIPPGSHGSIIVMVFSVTCNNCIGGQTCELIPSALEDDIFGWQADSGFFSYYCPPTATPTSSPSANPTATPTLPPTSSPTETATPTPTAEPTVPDMVWVAEATGCNADLVTVEILIDNPVSALDSFQFDMSYCSDMVEFISCERGDLTGDWLEVACAPPQFNLITGGGYAGLAVIPAGSYGSILKINFRVTCESCVDFDQCDLVLSNLQGGIKKWQSESGTFTYYCPPTPTVTPAPPTATPSPYPTPSDIIWATDESGCAGDTITVEIMIDNPATTLVAFQFDMSYCSEFLQYISCERGTLTTDWLEVGCNPGAPEVLTCGGYGGLSFVPPGSYGSVLRISFLVLPPAKVTPADCLLELFNLEADIEMWRSGNGSFTYYCPPTPTPVPVDRVWMGDALGCHGDLIVVPFMLSNPNTPVDTFTIDLNFCPDMLEYVSCEEGTLHNGSWLLFGCNESSPGVVTIGGVDFTPIPVGSYGSVALLTFTVNCPSCVTGDTCQLSLTNLRDDLVGWLAESGVFTYVCPTPTMLPTLTPTLTPTSTLSPTSAPTLTPTETASPSLTPTLSPTATLSPTLTPTVTLTATISPTLTPSKTATRTPTRSPTVTKTPTLTPTLTSTLTPTRTPTLTPTATNTATLSPTLTPTLSPTMSPTLTPTMTLSPTLSPTLTPTRTLSPTLSPTLTPTRTLSPTMSPTLTPTTTLSPTLSPTLTPTKSATRTPTVSPTSAPSLTPPPTLPPITETPAATNTPLATATPLPPCINSGDVNGDGSITSMDAQLAFSIAIGLYNPTYQEFCAADCNSDNSVTAGDALQIFYVVMGLDHCVDPIPS